MVSNVAPFSLTAHGAFQLLLASLLFCAFGVDTLEAQTPRIAPVASGPQQPGSEFWVEIEVGSDDVPVEDLFGTSFVLGYDETRLSVTEDEAGGFLGNDVVFSSNNDASAGEIGMGISRKSGAGGVDGSGTVARVKFEVGGDTPDGTTLAFSLGEVEANDPSGAAITLEPEDLAVEVETGQPPRATPRISVPFTVSDDAGGSVELTLGLDSEATEGNDQMFGEEQEPPFPSDPSSLVARWVDEDLGGGNGLSGFPDTGMEVDIRQGGIGFDGTRVHEIRFETGEEASEITFSWTLPDGVTGTLQDQTALGRGNVLDEEMDGSGSAALSNLDVTKAIVTLQYNLDASAAVGKRIGSDGLFNFGDTGADIDFSGVESSGTVTVQRFESGPSSTGGIAEENVSSFRLVIGTAGNLNFGNDTELRLAVGELRGISDSEQVTIYRRPEEGTGSFSSLQTSVDDGGTPADISDDELIARTGSFSEFVLASDSDPLPVELASFEGTVTGGEVRLTWQTASETNNSGFDVQRLEGEPGQAEGSSWTTVGFVEGAGTTSEPRSYRFTDEDLPYDAGRLSYRLRQVDTDGTTTLSDPVTVERSVSEVELLGTFPNPASQQAMVRFALPEQKSVEIRLYDALGREVRTIVNARKEGRQGERVDVSRLPSGTYFIRLRVGEQVKSEQMTVLQ